MTSEWDQYAARVELAILAGLEVSGAYDFSAGNGKNADVCEPSLSERGKVSTFLNLVHEASLAGFGDEDARAFALERLDAMTRPAAIRKKSSDKETE